MEKKNCPFCGEEIDFDAVKCPHCDEDLTSVKNIEKEENKPKCCKIKNLIKSNCVKILCGIIAVIVVFGICCNKYKIENTTDGIYLINQITGNVRIIEDTKVIETDKVKKIGAIEKNRLSQLKVLGEKTAKSSINCDLKYLWRDGKLYYKFSASPYEGELKKVKERGYGSFTIILKDTNGFTIKEIPVNVNSMTRIVDGSGQAQKMEMTDSIPLSYEDRKLIVDWDLEWNF